MAIDWLRITDELQAEVTRHGFEWIDFTHSAVQRSPWLRLYVDRRESSLTIDDITFLTRVLVTWLQAKLPESINFRLDVSSPGLDRPFQKPWQFAKQIGQHLQLTVHGEPALQGPLGKLTAVSESGITITLNDGSTVEYSWDRIVDGKVIFPVQEKNMKTKGTRR